MFEWVKVCLMLFSVVKLAFVSSGAAFLHLHHEKSTPQAVYLPPIYMKTGCLIAAVFS